jgi:hypothetical protein
MSAPAVVRLQAAGPVDIAGLLPELERRLNRLGEPPVLITAVDDLVCFHAHTWQPILFARVEDALDELIGSASRGGLICT